MIEEFKPIATQEGAEVKSLEQQIQELELPETQKTFLRTLREKMNATAFAAFATFLVGLTSCEDNPEEIAQFKARELSPEMSITVAQEGMGIKKTRLRDGLVVKVEGGRATRSVDGRDVESGMYDMPKDEQGLLEAIKESKEPFGMITDPTHSMGNGITVKRKEDGSTTVLGGPMANALQGYEADTIYRLVQVLLIQDRATGIDQYSIRSGQIPEATNGDPGITMEDIKNLDERGLLKKIEQTEKISEGKTVNIDKLTESLVGNSQTYVRLHTEEGETVFKGYSALINKGDIYVPANYRVSQN